MIAHSDRAKAILRKSTAVEKQAFAPLVPAALWVAFWTALNAKKYWAERQDWMKHAKAFGDEDAKQRINRNFGAKLGLDAALNVAWSWPSKLLKAPATVAAAANATGKAGRLARTAGLLAAGPAINPLVDRIAPIGHFQVSPENLASQIAQRQRYIKEGMERSARNNPPQDNTSQSPRILHGVS